MRSGDLPALKPLLAQLGYAVANAEISTRFQAVFDSPAHAAWVAVSAGRVIGFLHAFERPALEKPTEIVVQAMVVEKTLRKSGVGARLMMQTERWAQDRGHASIALSSQIDRADAHAFYARLGFEAAATSHLLRKKI